MKLHLQDFKSLKFPCPETLCILDFDNETDMFSHIESGSHQYVETKNTMDEALLYYAQQKHLKHSSDEATASNYSEHMLVDTHEDDLIHPSTLILWDGLGKLVEFENLRKNKKYLKLP